MNRQEFDSLTYHKPDLALERAAREKSGTRRFWFLAIPLGAVAAFAVTLVSGSGGAFFPAWGVFSFLIWGASLPEGE